jgi:hypothetical protein
MKSLGVLAILLLACTPNVPAAEDARERAAVEELVAAVNSARSANSPGNLETLLAKDLDQNERFAILAFERTLCAEARRPMSELSIPRLNIHTVRFLTPDVAEVEAVNVQVGSLTMVRRGSVMLLLKKEGARWRIFLLRGEALT